MKVLSRTIFVVFNCLQVRLNLFFDCFFTEWRKEKEEEEEEEKLGLLSTRITFCSRERKP